MNAALVLRSLWRRAAANQEASQKTNQEASQTAATLDRLARGCSAVVQSVEAPPGQPGWARQLNDLGFVCGGRVQLLHRSLPGGDPLVVRVGASTYALRRAEAACVRLRPEP